MKRRCYNKNDKRYHRYGGRGIGVCDKWLEYLGFKEDMGGSFKDGYSLERIDNDGNYEKLNCKWIPFKQQAKNRSTTNLITFEGKTMCMKDWEEHLGFKEGTIRARLRYYGWTIEEALTTNSYLNELKSMMNNPTTLDTVKEGEK